LPPLVGVERDQLRRKGLELGEHEQCDDHAASLPSSCPHGCSTWPSPTSSPTSPAGSPSVWRLPRRAVGVSRRHGALLVLPGAGSRALRRAGTAPRLAQRGEFVLSETAALRSSQKRSGSLAQRPA